MGDDYIKSLCIAIRHFSVCDILKSVKEMKDPRYVSSDAGRSVVVYDNCDPRGRIMCDDGARRAAYGCIRLYVDGSMICTDNRLYVCSDGDVKITYEDFLSMLWMIYSMHQELSDALLKVSSIDEEYGYILSMAWSMRKRKKNEI